MSTDVSTVSLAYVAESGGTYQFFWGTNSIYWNVQISVGAHGQALSDRESVEKTSRNKIELWYVSVLAKVRVILTCQFEPDAGQG